MKNTLLFITLAILVSCKDEKQEIPQPPPVEKKITYEYGFKLDDFDLIESGTIDSLFMMSLVTYLEQQHQVVFGMNDMVPKHFRSINSLSDFARSSA